MAVVKVSAGSKLAALARRIRRSPVHDEMRIGDRVVPIDLQHEEVFLAIARRCRPYTMTSLERQYALFQAVSYVVTAGIPGAFAECGVWRGGSSMLAALAFQAAGSDDREFFLYDTFAGMTEPTPVDGATASRRWRERQAEDHNEWAYAPHEEVARNLASTGLPADRFRLVKGPVEETIPGTVPERIALLRLDTDWYESTRHELLHLYDRLEPGGVLLIDDYGHWPGARRAVDEFIAERRLNLLLVRLDNTGRLALKPAA